MATTKLTLSVEKALVVKAKEYSRRHGTSISQMVSRFLAGLGDEEADYTPVVRRLLGTLPADVDAGAQRQHWEQKYGE